MPIYKPQFEDKLNEYQFNKLNLIDNLDLRGSLISILSYMMIINDRKNDQYNEHQLDFLKKNSNELKISFSEFRKLYVKNHKKLSLTTVKERIYKLSELGLLKISKVNNINSYTFITEKSEIPTTKNCTASTENTRLELNEDFCSFVDNINKDLDSNNPEGFDYENYIDSEQKVSDWDLVCKKTQDIFKMLKVKNAWIKETVIAKLSKYYSNVTFKHLDKYICTMITNARQQYYNNYNKLVKNAVAAPPLNFVNFEPRNYDYDALEERLLGWSSDKDLVLPIK
jgi:hypothetical protein